MDAPDASKRVGRSSPAISSDSLLPGIDSVSAGELALQQLDQLPTLSGIAVRILNLTSEDDFRAREVIELIGADPALASRVIRMCRCSPRGRASDVSTLERAVLLLGFDAIRSTVLSLKVFEVMERQGATGDGASQFNRHAFWLHSLAVASIAESIAALGVLPDRIMPGEAFLAGLLHDLGLLALHVALPGEVERICARYEQDGTPFDAAARDAIAIDSHTAGKRLAEHWSLPHCLGDVMWLCGQRLESLPQLPHRMTIALVSLADAIAARHHAVPVPGHSVAVSISQLADDLGVPAEQIDEIVAALPDTVAQRAAALGIEMQPASGELLQAIARANESLGRTNHRLRDEAERARHQQRMLAAIRHFHSEARPTESVVSVLQKIAGSATTELGAQFIVILFQPRAGRHWLSLRYASDGRLLASEQVPGPEAMPEMSQLLDGKHVSLAALGILPWIESIVGDGRQTSELRLLPLPCGLGMQAMLIHDGPQDGDAPDGLDALAATWAGAIAAAAQHEGARRLGEQLATANARLTDTQDQLASARAMASIGEIAAGAAHEMNNPLTVISGRSQLLARRLGEAAAEGRVEESSHDAARQIVLQAHRLSNLITMMRMFAEPANAVRCNVDVVALVRSIVHKFRAECGDRVEIDMRGEAELDPAWLDPDHVGQAMAELIRNATEADANHVSVSIHVLQDKRLVIEVADDGRGLPEYALAHAFDPFFSMKQAGRQPGVGLAQARRLLGANGGELTLDNRVEGGAIARIILTRWRAVDHSSRQPAAQPRIA